MAKAKRTKGDGGVDGDDDDDGKRISLATMEAEWDAFMEKSTRPGEDDDEEEGGEGGEDDNEEEEEERSVEEDEGSAESEKEDGRRGRRLVPRGPMRQIHDPVDRVPPGAPRDAYALISPTRSIATITSILLEVRHIRRSTRSLPSQSWKRKEFEVEEIDDIVRG